MKNFPINKKEAVNGTRTRDLRLTKATLYHLSYNSICKKPYELIFYQKKGNLSTDL